MNDSHMDLGPISSIQCVDVLWRLGFKIDDASDARVRLVRDGRAVSVPRHRIIEPIELRVILHTAGVHQAEFLAVLQRRTKSGEMAEPPAPATTGVRVSEPKGEPKTGKKRQAG